MGKWRVAAAVVIGLLCAAAVVVRGVSSGFLASVVFPPHADVRDAVNAALVDMAAGGRPIAILAESADVDRTVIDALSQIQHTRVAMLTRDGAAIDEAVHAGEVLALQSGRQYLELVGFELEWLSQSPTTPVFPWARVRRRLQCAAIRDDRWSPLSGVEYTGRLGIQLPADRDGKIVLVIGDAVPLDIEAEGTEGMPIPIHKDVLRAGPASGAPADFWLGDGNPWSAPAWVVRLTIDALPARDHVLSLRLGRRAPRVLARLREYDPAARAHVCAAPLGLDQAFRNTKDLVVLPDTPEYFGTGWYGPELGPFDLGSVRWMKGQGAILVPSARRGAMDILIRGAPAAAAGDGTTLTLTVNDMFTTAPVTLASGPSSYRWAVPAPTWLAGTNELLFTISRTARPSERDTRDLGFALQRLELSLIPDH